MFVVTNVKFSKVTYLMDDCLECLEIDIYTCDSKMDLYSFEDTAYHIPRHGINGGSDDGRTPTDWRISRWHME